MCYNESIMEIKRIYLPKPNLKNEHVTYEKQLQPRQIFGNSKLEGVFRKNEDRLMKIVEQSVLEYVNCEELCCDDEGMFPRPKFMTGEWYVRDVYFQDDYLSICTAFLGTDLGYKDDYLGLEVVFHYDEESEGFCVYGVNSESI